jgi:hypothetical protein
MLAFRQAPDGESDDMNHTEPEFLLQAVNEKKICVCEANGRRLEFLVLHES